VLVADPTRTHSVLNWTAARDLTEIVSSAWKWMLSDHRSVAKIQSEPVTST
jgi:UDP-glucose 4-epimerase